MRIVSFIPVRVVVQGFKRVKLCLEFSSPASLEEETFYYTIVTTITVIERK